MYAKLNAQGYLGKAMPMVLEQVARKLAFQLALVRQFAYTGGCVQTGRSATAFLLSASLPAMNQIAIPPG